MSTADSRSAGATSLEPTAPRAVGPPGDTAPVPSFYRDPEAPEPNNPLRVGVVAFVERDGSLLLERRADFGTWGIPGGALDEDETVEQGITREVLEETGLEVLSIELLGVFSDPSRIIAYGDGNVHRLLTLAFVVSVAPGPPRVSEESLELRFVPFSRVRDFEIGAALVPVVDAFLEGRARPVVA